MKITEAKLRKHIRQKIAKKLNESSDFTARREIMLSAQNASMEFEKEILTRLGIVDPNTMHPDVQKKYFEIVEQMKEGMLNVVKNAVTRMSALPRNDNGEGK